MSDNSILTLDIILNIVVIMVKIENILMQRIQVIGIHTNYKLSWTNIFRK